MAAAVEIIVVGNEILQGDVLDTNSHWLCKEVTALGAVVCQVTQVRDDRLAIAEALRLALRRGNRLILLTGGLGPTADDLTLEAVALALGVPLREHPQALAWVAETYRRLAAEGHVLSAEMTPQRAKMAHLPAGAEPLYNPVGAAPGVLYRLAGCAIVCLPGVPAELKAIYQGALLPFLKEWFGRGAFVEWVAVAACNDESVLAPILMGVARGHPGVYIKSRARAFGESTGWFTITLSTQGEMAAEAEGRVRAAWEDLYTALERAGLEAHLELPDPSRG